MLLLGRENLLKASACFSLYACRMSICYSLSGSAPYLTPRRNVCPCPTPAHGMYFCSPFQNFLGWSRTWPLLRRSGSALFRPVVLLLKGFLLSQDRDVTWQTFLSAD